MNIEPQPFRCLKAEGVRYVAIPDVVAFLKYGSKKAKERESEGRPVLASGILRFTAFELESGTREDDGDSPDRGYHPIRARIMEDGSGVVVTRGENLDIARSEHPHEAVTLDFDPQGNLIQVEVAASPIYRTKSGRVLSDADIQALADEAERGYDLAQLRPLRDDDESLIPPDQDDNPLDDEDITVSYEHGEREVVVTVLHKITGLSVTRRGPVGEEAGIVESAKNELLELLEVSGG